ncbi:hypothetical protein HDU67_008517 [Dinochytrium kinnereticum]|nr:hypothetical protein HDU67_008517 [Dinochytrium kinnereticum]
MPDQILNRWAADVLALFPTRTLADVLIDLKHTRSVESTINRILDDTFLAGTERDPSFDVILVDEHQGGVRGGMVGEGGVDGVENRTIIDLSKTPAPPPRPTAPSFNLDQEEEDDDADLLPTSIALFSKRSPHANPSHSSSVASSRDEPVRVSPIKRRRVDDDRVVRAMSTVDGLSLSPIKRYTPRRQPHVVGIAKGARWGFEPSPPKKLTSSMERQTSFPSENTEDPTPTPPHQANSDTLDKRGAGWTVSPSPPRRSNSSTDRHHPSSFSSVAQSTHLPRPLSRSSSFSPAIDVTDIPVIPRPDATTSAVERGDRVLVELFGRRGGVALDASKVSVGLDEGVEESVGNERKRKRAGVTDKEEERMRKIAEKEEKVRQKEAEKERKRQEKEMEKESKRLAKELAAAEKRRAVEEMRSQTVSVKNANKLRDKHTAAREMIVTVDPLFFSHRGGASALNAVEEIGATVRVLHQPLSKSLSFSRKVTREWDDTAGRWTPCPEKIMGEPFVIVRIDAADLSGLLTGDCDLDKVLPQGGGPSREVVAPSHLGQPLVAAFPRVDPHASSRMAKIILDAIRKAYPGRTPIIVVEGYRALLRERNRVVDARVREEMRKAAGGKGRVTAGLCGGRGVIASKEMFEMVFLWWQFQGYCFVYFVDKGDEFNKVFVSFTMSVGLIPERTRRNEQSFNLNFGDTVKSGKDIQDTWRRMIMEVKPCSEAAADAIIERYPTFRSLHEAYSRAASRREGETLLENLAVRRLTGLPKRLGPTLSKKIYAVMMGVEESVVLAEAGAGSGKEGTRVLVSSGPPGSSSPIQQSIEGFFGGMGGRQRARSGVQGGGFCI